MAGPSHNQTSPSDYDESAQTILDSLSAHVAILDENGFILKTNRAWKQFAEHNSIQMRPDTIKVNYLEICDSENKSGGDSFSFISTGIKKVIDGTQEEFVMDYPCHSPTEKRWFNMRVTRAHASTPLRIIISHEDITPLKIAEEQARISEQELLTEKSRLEALNTTLKVLLDQRENDKSDMESSVVDNIHQLIYPLIKQLHNNQSNKQKAQLLRTLERHLEQITQPFLRRIATVDSTLTPQEVRIAALIRDGLSSKEISKFLNLSLTTVHFHRRNLRTKLKLAHTQTNLQSFLASLSH